MRIKPITNFFLVLKNGETPRHFRGCLAESKTALYSACKACYNGMHINKNKVNGGLIVANDI